MPIYDRLDQADADRRQALDRLAAAQERIAALLTDQRPSRPALVAAMAARMTPAAPDPFEVARAELVEALAGMVNRVIAHGKPKRGPRFALSM